MRNLSPGPKFSVLVATVVVVTLAVWPIGYAEAEKISAERQKEKRSAEESDISLKQRRSAPIRDLGAYQPAEYQTWETGDDDVYPDQADPSDSNSYEDDGYGYDDDEYDHFNYKRYDNGKSKLDEGMKASNEENKGGAEEEKGANGILPEATTIEMLSFQAKNMNSKAENMPSPKDDATKMKPFPVKKPEFPDKAEEQEPLIEEKVKKKTFEGHKSDGNSNDQSSGNIEEKRIEGNKPSDMKESTENKIEKVKDAADSGTTSSSGVRNSKENPGITGPEENSNNARVTDKDLKAAEAKIHQDETSGVKIKAEKDMDAKVDEAKVDSESAKDDSREKNLSQFEANILENDDYKDGFDNMNYPVLADDEKGSEDSGMNLAGLRDSRTELPYRNSNAVYPGKFIKKKETSRRMHQGSHISDRENKAHARESLRTSGTKEPFHLEFPVSDFENADYHRNHLKSFQRFDDLGESAHILSQGDTPNPYADETKKYISPKVIEEEQRKRRSRLRRLKANPAFATVDEGEGDSYDYGYAPRIRTATRYGLHRRNILGKGYGPPSFAQNYRRRGVGLPRDGTEIEFEEEETNNVKNKRQDNPGSYKEEDETYTTKRKSHLKSAWNGGENATQKKKMKEANVGDQSESNRYNSPLVLLRRNDNGQQAIKTFVDGRYKNDESVDSEDLARLLSRDSNYVVLKKVPSRDQVRAQGYSGNSKSSIADSKKKVKITHSDLMIKAQHSPDAKVSDIGKLTALLKEGHGDRLLKGKENRIEDLSDFFKVDVQEDRDLDEKKEVVLSLDNHPIQYHRGEFTKNVVHKTLLPQSSFRHMKDLNEEEKIGDSDINMITVIDTNSEVDKNNGQSTERLLKSFRKNGKEFLVINKAYGVMSLKDKSQDPMTQNPEVPGTANVMPNSASNPVVNNAAGVEIPPVLPDAMKMPGASMMPADAHQNWMIPPNSYPNGMMPANGFQEIKLPEVQRGMEATRKYFLYGSDNDMANAPKHEVRVMQGGFQIPPSNPYNTQNYNQQFLDWQNYKFSTMKNPQGGKVQPSQESKKDDQYSLLSQPYGYAKPQQCLALGVQQANPSPETKQGFNRLAIKDKSSGGLERFIRDFQDFSQASYPDTYKSTDLPGMTLQELTGHGGRQLQKLNNILKEIMGSNAEETGTDRTIKNLKRGMFQKYKDEKNGWPLTGRGGEAQVRSGKWTSVVYDGSSQSGYSDKNNSPGESSLKDRKLEAKNPPTMLDSGSTLSKRTKRQARYDFKDSTKILEHKVQSTPCTVQLQPLFPRANTAASSSNTRQHKSSSKSHLQLPPEKLMDLINFFRSERDEFDREKSRNAALCRRRAQAEDESQRSEREDSDVKDGQKKTECVRRSFESYLDPLVRRIGKYETKAEDRTRRKREIELDESMPNDFQNFLVTSLGSFGSQKRGVVKKDEAVWDSEGSREESALGKRDTSGAKPEKSSVSKEDATNIRIKIVDGNGNGELEAKASEGAELSKERKTGDVESNGASVHEVYLITNADSKRKKKKKFANIRSDQSPQKQPMSNHLPQVETVYNPSPGSNKAQMEKISGDSQMKGKYSPSQPQCNASTMEDNIIRNNLRTGNINTFTYQHKEDPTPYPLHDPTNPPSSEFEVLTSKSLSQSKPKTISNQAYGRGDTYVPSGSANNEPEIIYKDQAPLHYKSSPSKGLSLTRPDYRSNSEFDGYKGEREGSGFDRCRKDRGEEESVSSEYDDGEFFSGESPDRQAYQDYEERDSGKQGSRRQDAEYSRAQEYLDPKMVALWKDYARTHLSPERHKEAMEREFQEAFVRSSGQMRYVGAYMNHPNFGANLMQNVDSNYFDYMEKEEDKAREKLNKRRLATSSKPVQVGKRYYYSFKSELPDEAYYSMNKEPSRLKSLDANVGNRFAENREKSSVMQLNNRQLENAKAPLKYNSDHFQATRVKRSEDDAESVRGSNVEERLSSGRLTENHYQKYHKKNPSLKRDDEPKEGRGKREEGKRDSLAEFLKSDIMRRIEEEKKIRSKVKGLTSDLNEWEIPVVGLKKENPVGEKASQSDIFIQRADEDKKKEKDRGTTVNLQNQQQQQVMHQFGRLKNGNPDVFKTFDIKRGRREECSYRAKKKRTAWPGEKHAIVSRGESAAAPQDDLFFKDVKKRKVKKYSNEGFEPLTPDVRFSDKSSFYSEPTKNSDGPYRVLLDEKETAGIKRRAGDKMPKAKHANSGGQQKLQKLTHGFSHEAPLLTSSNSIISPKIFDALRVNPSPKEDLSSRKYAPENSLLVPGEAQERSHLKSSKEAAAASSSTSKEPLVSAVLVLAKREDASGRRTETDHLAQSSLQMVERRQSSSGEEEERSSGVEKRKAEWLKRAARGDISRLHSGGQSPEIVNEEDDSRCSEGDTPAKTVSNKMVHKVKKSFIPSRQMHNDTNENGTGIGNPGENILESILGRVEANPHFRKVIGPGLKWRGAKCYHEASGCKRLISVPSRRGLFFNQVKKVLARFVKDIEMLASQEFSQNICCKLDNASKRFLRELLDVEVDTAGTSKRRKFLESFLREPSWFESRVKIADEEPSSNRDVGAKQSRRDLVARLLDEYRSLPDDEKKSVEVLGQYLNHELETLNRALPTVGVSSADGDEKHEERLALANSQECGAVNAEKTGIASDAAPEVEPGPKRGSAGTSHARSNQEGRKSGKDDSPQSNAPTDQVPSRERFAPPFTEKSNSECSGGSAGTAVSGSEERRSPEGRRPPGHGDAAGLQQSPKSRGGWPTYNPFPGKGNRARHAWRVPKQQSATVLDESVKGPLSTGERSDVLDYQEYNAHHVYQAPKAS